MKVVRDERIRDAMHRFLLRCHPIAKANAETDPTMPVMLRIKVFLSEWISETLYRFYQSQLEFPSSQATVLFHMLCENGAIPAAFMLGIGSLPERWPVIRNIVERVYAQLSVGGRHGHLAQLPVVPLPPHEEQMVTSGKRCPDESQAPQPDATLARLASHQAPATSHTGRRGHTSWQTG